MNTANATPTIPWNLVTQNLHGHELLRKKIRQKLGKLARHLKHFPPDAVHLHLSLERHPHKDHYTAALTLRLPSNVLHSEKAGPDLIRALDEAVRALFRELEGLKADLRREALWKRKARREQLRQIKLAGFAPAPQPEGEGPQNLRDVLRDLLQAHYPRLLRYVRRQLWHDITAGELPPNAIDPRAVVDEVARRALTEPARKPASLSHRLWFYALARQELARRRQALKSRAATVESLDAPRPSPDAAARAEGYDAEQPLDRIERRLQPPVIEGRDQLAAPPATRPDEAVVRQELLAELRRATAQWPRPERELFELFFVEGFEPDEIAMLLGRSEPQVRQLLHTIQDRLRAEVREMAEV